MMRRTPVGASHAGTISCTRRSPLKKRPTSGTRERPSQAIDYKVGAPAVVVTR